MSIFIEFLYLDYRAIKTTLLPMGNKVIFIALYKYYLLAFILYLSENDFLFAEGWGA